MDTLSPLERAERMRRIGSSNTKPELVVRRMVYAMRFRYRLHEKRLPGRPDLVFWGRHKVIFVHGCFWHRHSDPACKLARMPKTKLDFWQSKFEKNRERDLRILNDLEGLGWQSLIVWECELSHKEQLENKVREFLKDKEA
jgi:DNA mismatch endonuclease (patch repair protein)